ncbi:hypothetical protein [uncultured Treponema sp.]|uniref:hypothetical protein n=1 Tax=uncultured Treponema sp. TaxID=162155 RepID=UPI0025969AE2|nr:hypothetical protein [uncultured Treponema sp.]
MILSQISKLLLPVIASIPRRSSMLDFFGRFAPLIEESSEFVTQGGFPIKKRFSFLSIKFFIKSIELKKSAFTIFVF